MQGYNITNYLIRYLRQGRNGLKAGKIRLKGKQEKTQWQARKDSMAAKTRLKGREDKA